MGIWSSIEPKNLPKSHQSHGLFFASYIEAPSERGDNNWYRLFTFRNTERTEFGKKEFLSESLSPINFEHLAKKVIIDPAYKQSLVAESKHLNRMWKRR